jgi:hypothetical protein
MERYTLKAANNLLKEAINSNTPTIECITTIIKKLESGSKSCDVALVNFLNYILQPVVT